MAKCRNVHKEKFETEKLTPTIINNPKRKNNDFHFILFSPTNFKYIEKTKKKTKRDSREKFVPSSDRSSRLPKFRENVLFWDFIFTIS